MLEFYRVIERIFGALVNLGVDPEPEPEPELPRSDTDQQMDFLRAFLRAEITPSAPGLYYWGRNTTKSDRAVLSGGGYELLHRLDGSNAAAILALDRPIALLPVETWRAKANVAAREVGVELLPLSYTAYGRVRVDGVEPRLVHRAGFEAVFSIAEKFYLSAYDQQEDPPLYFLCRLPHAVATVDEAREALKPESVTSAEKSGATVMRQGDLFFIETELDDIDVRIGAKSVVTNEADPGGRILYGTAHYADAVAHLRSGVMLANGTVRHDPRLVGQRRLGDHSDLELPTGWWIVSRNTVPASAGAPARLEPSVHHAWFESWFGVDAELWQSLMGLGGIPAPQPVQPWAISRDEPGEEG
jgi:hypothetical protein